MFAANDAHQRTVTIICEPHLWKLNSLIARVPYWVKSLRSLLAPSIKISLQGIPCPWRSCLCSIHESSHVFEVCEYAARPSIVVCAFQGPWNPTMLGQSWRGRTCVYGEMNLLPHSHEEGTLA